jgi:hypothetical protein
VCLASIERALIGGFVVCRRAMPAILGGSFFLYFAQKKLATVVVIGLKSAREVMSAL